VLGDNDTPRWGSVPAQIRAAVEARLAQFQPLSEDVELSKDGPQGKLDLSQCGVTSDALASLFRSRRLAGVRSLNLRGNELTTLPPEISSLVALQTLDLRDNLLEALPSTIGALTDLQELCLGSNMLTTLPPQIGLLSALKSLLLGSRPRDVELQNGFALRTDEDLNSIVTLPPEIALLKALETLDFSSNDLATLPTIIGSLTALQSLDLSRNKLTTLPPEIGLLTALQTLDLSGNQLTTLPPEIGLLTALQTLDLSANQLATLPREIGSLTALHTLNLSDHQFETLPAVICRLTALKALDLRSECLTELPPEIGSLTALQELQLGSNRLTKLPSQIGSLTSLRELSVESNQLTTLPPEIGSLTALQRLGLGGNQIKELPIEIRSLTALQTLVLERNQMTALPREIGSLTSLLMLFLSGNELTTLPAETDRLTKLHELCLNGNRLTEAGRLVELIGKLPALRRIKVEGNGLRWPGMDNPIPSEVCGENIPHKLVARLLEYRAESGIQRRPILSIRAAVVGRKEIGKSHLWHRLCTDNVLDNTNVPKKTLSWELRTMVLEGAGPEKSAVELRFFDHGGDLELHGGHRTFFGDKRCIYTIVVDASKPRQLSLMDYWLRIVRCYGVYADDAADGLPCAPTVVVLSWRDQGVDASFARDAIDEPSLRGAPELDVTLVRDYWEPIGKGGAGARSRRAKEHLKDLTHGERFRAVRVGLVQAIGHLHRELAVAYPLAYTNVIRDCEAQGGLLSRGPVTVAQIRKAFYDATNNENELNDNVGLDLLRNLGVVICPDRDAELAHDLRDHVRARSLDLLSSQESEEGKRARVELKDLVFGLQWLRCVMYEVVSGKDFKTEENGVISHKFMMTQLTVLVGGSNTIARQILEFLKLQRLVFDYCSQDAEQPRYIVVDRIPETSEKQDEELLESQTERFSAANRYTMTLRLLLATHLSQFIGRSYAKLRGADTIERSMRRDRVVVHDNTATHVLLTTDLNASMIHAAAIGGSTAAQQELLARIRYELTWLTGDTAGWVPVEARTAKEKRSSDATKARPLADDTAIKDWRDERGEQWGLEGDRGLATVPIPPMSGGDKEGNPKAILTAPGERIRRGQDPTLLSTEGEKGETRQSKTLVGDEIGKAMLDAIEKFDNDAYQVITRKWAKVHAATKPRGYCDALTHIHKNYPEFNLPPPLSETKAEVDKEALCKSLAHVPVLTAVRDRLLGRASRQQPAT